MYTASAARRIVSDSFINFGVGGEVEWRGVTWSAGKTVTV